MSFQIFILVGHLTNWTGHNLLTDNTLKKITQDVLVRCAVIVSDHNVKLAGHFQNLVGQCPMTDCYFQHCVSDHFPGGKSAMCCLLIILTVICAMQIMLGIQPNTFTNALLNTKIRQHYWSTFFASSW